MANSSGRGNSTLRNNLLKTGNIKGEYKTATTGVNLANVFKKNTDTTPTPSSYTASTPGASAVQTTPQFGMSAVQTQPTSIADIKAKADAQRGTTPVVSAFKKRQDAEAQVKSASAALAKPTVTTRGGGESYLRREIMRPGTYISPETTLAELSDTELRPKKTEETSALSWTKPETEYRTWSPYNAEGEPSTYIVGGKHNKGEDVGNGVKKYSTKTLGKSVYEDIEENLASPIYGKASEANLSDDKKAEIGLAYYDQKYASGPNWTRQTPEEYRDSVTHKAYQSGITRMNRADITTPTGQAIYRKVIADLDKEIEAAQKDASEKGRMTAAGLLVARSRLEDDAKANTVFKQKSDAQELGKNTYDAIAATGFTSAADYDTKSAAGMKAIEDKLSFGKFMDDAGQGISTDTGAEYIISRWDRYNALPDELKAVLGYIYETEGWAAVKEELKAGRIGQVAAAVLGADTAAVVESPYDAVGNQRGAAKPELDKGLAGFANFAVSIPRQFANYIQDAVRAVKDVFSKDKGNEGFHGYTADKMRDYTIENMLDSMAETNGVTATELTLYGENVARVLSDKGFEPDWYVDVMANGSKEEKTFYNILLNNNSPEEVEAVYNEIEGAVKETTDALGKKSKQIARPSEYTASYRDAIQDLDTDMSMLIKGKTREQAITAIGDAVSQQLGQMAIGLASPTAALGIMVTGAGAKSYLQTRDEGYGKGRSAVMGVGSGLIEWASEKLFDSITGINGVVPRGLKLTDAVNKVAKPMVQGAFRMGIDAVNEGNEEVFSEVMGSLLRRVALGDTAAFDNLGSRAFESWVTAVIGTLLVGGPGEMATSSALNEYGAETKKTIVKAYGGALSEIGATDKIVDTVLSADLGKLKGDAKEAYDEAKALAQKMKGNDKFKSDVNVGRMTQAFLSAGGDLNFLTTPETVSYTKDQISYDDYIAGAKAMLTRMGGDVRAAEAIVKTHLGEQLTDAEQALMDNEPNAQEILNQFAGDLDMKADNALTIAARMTIFKNAEEKVYQAIKESNPDVEVAGDITNALYSDGMDYGVAKDIGDILERVRTGQDITLEEAKSIKLTPPVLSVLQQDRYFGITGINQYSTAETLMDALNVYADAVRQTKDLQKETAANAALAARVQAGQQNRTTGGTANESNTQSTPGVQAPGMAGGSVQEVQGSQSQDVTGGNSGDASQGQGANGDALGAVRGRGLNEQGDRGSILLNENPDAPGFVIPLDALDNFKQFIKQQGQTIPDWMRNTNLNLKTLMTTLANDGVGQVIFVFAPTLNVTGVHYLNDGVYTVEINLARKSTNADKIAKHETIHLWLEALDSGHKSELLSNLVNTIFGSETTKAFKYVEDAYAEKYGDRENLVDLINEELLAYAFSGYDFTKVGGFNFNPFRGAAIKAVEEAGLRAIALGDMTNPETQMAIENNWYNPAYLQIQNLSEVIAAINGEETDEFGEPITQKVEPKVETPDEKAAKAFTKKGEGKGKTKKGKTKTAEPKTAEPKTETPDEKAAKAFTKKGEGKGKKTSEQYAFAEDVVDEEDSPANTYALVLPDASVIYGTDNLDQEHIDMLLREHGEEFDDMSDFLDRGGIRNKPGHGVELSGNNSPSSAALRELGNIVKSFAGKSFTIDFNIDGTLAGTYTFDAPVSMDTIEKYLSNYYKRRSMEVQDNAFVRKAREVLGVPVKSSTDALNMLSLWADNPPPFLDAEDIAAARELIQKYNSGERFALSEDELTREEELGEYYRQNAADDEVYENDLWDVGEENPDAEPDVLDDAAADALLASIDMDALSSMSEEEAAQFWAKYQGLQEQNTTKKVEIVEGNITPSQLRQIEKDMAKKAESKAAPFKKNEAKETKTEKVEPEAKTEKAEEKTPSKRGRKKSNASAFQKNEAVEQKTEPAKPKSIQAMRDRLDALMSKVESGEASSAEMQEMVALMRSVDNEIETAAAETKELKAKAEAKKAETKKAETKKAETKKAETKKAEAFKPKAETEKTKPVVETTAEPVTEVAKEPEPAWAPEPEGAEGWTRIAPDNKYKRFSERDRVKMEKAIRNADTFQIRKKSPYGNLYQVILEGENGTVLYDDVSPATLRNALQTKDENGRMNGKAMADLLMETATNLQGQTYVYEKEELAPAEKKPTKAELKKAAGKDAYGRQVSPKMGVYMSESKAREGDSTDGALVPLYTVEKGNGIRNEKAEGKARWLTDKPSVANTHRGLSGVSAYALEGHTASRIRAIQSQLKDAKPGSKKYEKLYSDLARLEKKNREYTQGITKLDPFREGYTSAKNGGMVNDKVVLEAYANIKNPLIVNAKGQGREFVAEITRQLQNQSALEENKYDGAIIHNCNFVAVGKTLLGGPSGLSTIYVTLYNDQVKSTYNTQPTNSPLMQYALSEDSNEAPENYVYHNQGALEEALGNTNSAEGAKVVLDEYRQKLRALETTTDESDVAATARELINELDRIRENAFIGDAIHVLTISDEAKKKVKNNELPMYALSEDAEDTEEQVSPGYDTGFTPGSLEDIILKAVVDKDQERATAALAELMAIYIQTGEMANEKTKTNPASVFQPRVTDEQRNIYQDQAKEWITQHGALPKGEKAARDIPFPVKTDGGYVRRTARTIAETKNVRQAGADLILRGLVQDTAFEYARATNKEAIANADRELKRKGYDRLLAEWQGKIDVGQKMDKNTVALGETLLIEAARIGDFESFYQLSADVAEVATTAGQVSQSISMLKRLPATWQMYYINRMVNRKNHEYAKMINKGKMSEIVLNKDLVNNVLKAKTSEEIDAAMDVLISDIASQIPATMMEKWNAWRYLAMLGNPKTHIRNFLGNSIFLPAKFAKDLLAAGAESVVIKDPTKRTTSVKGVLHGDKAMREFAMKDFEGIRDELQNGGKHNPADRIDDARTIFGFKWLESLRRTNGEWLEAEDGMFLKTHYVNSLTNYLTTQGVDLATLQSTKEGGRILNAARMYAFIEARKATYRDASETATALNRLKKSGSFGGVLLDGILPFVGTPVNVLRRGIEYSPIGLLKTVTKGTYDLKNGNIDANTFCDNLASGMTGTMVAALGVWLAALGLLKGGDDDDEKQQNYNELQGYQNYSINIGGKSFTIDWTAPVALPLFVGAELYRNVVGDGELSAGDMLELVTIIAEPITQLSMLSGLKDALTSAKWDDNPIASLIETALSSYASQGLPTMLAQVSRSMVADRRMTYVDKNSDLQPAIQRWLQTNLMGKTPLNGQRMEYVDAWGRKDTTESVFLRFAENMLSPGYINDIETSDMEAELQRLADATGTGVLMTVPEKEFTVGNSTYYLSADEYQLLASTRGQTAYTALTNLVHSEWYTDPATTDDEKAEAVNNIISYATYLGRKAVMPEYAAGNGQFNWIDKCDGDENRVMNFALLKASKPDGVDADHNYEFYNFVGRQDWMSAEEQGYAIAQCYTTGSTKTVYTGRSKYTLTDEGKKLLADRFRLIFPAYYVELASSETWRYADDKARKALLSDLYSDVNGTCKEWLAQYYQSIGAETVK